MESLISQKINSLAVPTLPQSAVDDFLKLSLKSRIGYVMIGAAALKDKPVKDMCLEFLRMIA